MTTIKTEDRDLLKAAERIVWRMLNRPDKATELAAKELLTRIEKCMQRCPECGSDEWDEHRWSEYMGVSAFEPIRECAHCHTEWEP